jgi:SAM-dependent methyltransferase
MNAVQYYSDTATEFHDSYRADANRLERLDVWRDFLNRHSAGAAFAYDVGCGSGILACELAARGIETIGLDGAAPMLAIATDIARGRGLSNVQFRQEQLPLSDISGLRQADLVISSSAIEYFQSIDESLLFLRNLLGQTGVIIFSLSNRDAISRKVVRWVHRITGRPRYIGFLRHFITVDDIPALLTAAGLTYLEHTYFGRADRLNQFLCHFLPARVSSNMIIVAARKPIASEPGVSTSEVRAPLSGSPDDARTSRHSTVGV